MKINTLIDEVVKAVIQEKGVQDDQGSSVIKNVENYVI